jgi:hypothetical protein
MAGVGSKSRGVECISSSFPFEEFVELNNWRERNVLVSWSEEDAYEAVDRDMARADKPTIGRYRLRLRFFELDPEPEC